MNRRHSHQHFFFLKTVKAWIHRALTPTRTSERFRDLGKRWISFRISLHPNGLKYLKGKGWSESQIPAKARLRQDAGLGIGWMVDTVSLIQVPIKFEVAYPLNDPDYKKPQYILLGTLSW